MDNASKSAVSQQFGNTTVADGSLSFQGIVHGDVHLNQPHPNPLSFLESLPEAAFNAKSRQHASLCLRETRRDVLAQIYQWADGNGERGIYWLKGMAGTGKSTIAMTVARDYYNKGRLGASYFFSRGNGDLATAGRFAMTVAAQLAEILPAFRQYICDKATFNRHIRDLGLYDQWEKLILEPLSQMVQDAPALPILIVVDALDECGNQDDVSLLIRCLQVVTTGVELRFLVTSRPDQLIDISFERMSKVHEYFILHDIEQSIVDHDLTVYYQHELGDILQQFSSVESISSEDAVKVLVGRSNGLFIHAATVCRFVREGKQLAFERLSVLLEENKSTIRPEKELDHIYTTVLESSSNETFNSDESTRLRSLFHRVVGSIVVLFDTISPANLATIHEMRQEEVRSVLNYLSPVLDLPKQDTMLIRLLHPSFRDYLLDPTRCRNQYFINAQTTHRYLLDCCLQVMESHLTRPDICNLHQPGIRACDIPRPDVEKNIPYVVQYSCRYWIYHLQQSQTDPREHPGIEAFFKTHYLFWLETLALLGRLSDAIVMIQILDKLLAGSDGFETRPLLARMKAKFKPKPPNNADAAPPLHRVVYDALRFLSSYSSIIEETPLQLYCSALRFSPTASIIRKFYSCYIPTWITPTPAISEYWSPYLQVLLGHSHWVLSAVFSSDGKLVASASEDQTVRLWDAITGAERRVLSHSDSVLSVRFSPDGRLLASASDQSVLLWDVNTGIEQRNFTHSGLVNSVAFSPDGRLLASASGDKTVRLWDVVTGDETRVLSHSDSVLSVVFSPNGTVVASSSDDQTVRLWDVMTGVVRRVFAHSHPVRSVAFSPDGSLIALASKDQTVRFWDVNTGAKRRLFKGHLVAFSPNGRLVALASDDHAIRIWDANTGDERCVLQGHSYSVNSVAFSSDGRFLVSASDDKTIRLWNMTMGDERHVSQTHYSHLVNSVAFSSDGRLVVSASGNEAFRLGDTHLSAGLRVPKGHSDMVDSVAFSPDGKLIATASNDRTIRIWDANTGAEQRVLEGHSHAVTSVSFSPPDGRLIASASNDKTVRLWNATTGHVQHVLQGHSHKVLSVAFSPDGKFIASGSWDRTIRLWDTTTGLEGQVIKGHTQSVRSVAFSPDGKLIASVSWDKTLRLWDANTGNRLHVLKGHSHSIRWVAFSSDSGLVASASWDKTVVLWDTSTGEKRRVLNHPDFVNSVAFSPDGRLMASALRDKTVWLWDTTTTSSKRRVLKGHSDSVRSVAFSPDSRFVAAVSWDKTARLWDTATGAERRVFQGHSDWVWVIALSTDGRLVALASGNKIVLWDWSTGTERRILRGHSDSVTAVAFSPDSKLVASASRDKTVRLWTIGTYECIRKVDLEIVSNCLCFDPDGLSLVTDAGSLSIAGLIPADRSLRSSSTQAISDSGYGLSKDGVWITWRGSNLLCLPADARQERTAVSGSTVVIGCDSGRVIFVHLSAEGLSDFGHSP